MGIARTYDRTMLLVLWILLAIVLFVLLFAAAVGVRRRDRRPVEPPPAAEPAPAAPSGWNAPQEGTLDIAVVSFDGVVGAERAFAGVREDAGADPWLSETAFVEHHHRDRIVVRGTFAGRYLDVEEVGGRLLEEILADVPEGSSALVVFARTEDVGAMLRAFEGSGGRVTRHQVSATDAAAFEASVAQAPPAAPPPAVR
jgi:hypothetical protein